MSWIKNSSKTMLSQSVTPLVDLGFATSTINDTRQRQTAYKTAEPGAARDQLRAKIAGNDKAIRARLAPAVGKTVTGDVEKSTLAKVDTDLDAYIKARTQLLGMYDTAADVNAIAISDFSRLHVTPAIGALTADFDKLYAAKYTLAKQQQAQIEATGNSNRTRSIVLLVLAFVASLGLMLWVARGIERSVKLILERLSSLRDHCVSELNNALTAIGPRRSDYRGRRGHPQPERPAATRSARSPRPSASIRDSTVASVEAYNATRAALAQMIGVIPERERRRGRLRRDGHDLRGGRPRGRRDRRRHRRGRQGAERQVRAVESRASAAEEIGHRRATSAANAQRDRRGRRAGARLAEDGATPSAGHRGDARRARRPRPRSTERDPRPRRQVRADRRHRRDDHRHRRADEPAGAQRRHRGRPRRRAGPRLRRRRRGGPQAGRGVADAPPASIAELIGEIQGETQRAVEVVEDGAAAHRATAPRPSSRRARRSSASASRSPT